MYIWDEILEQKPNDKGKPIISLVFEDEHNTFDERCLLLKRFRRNPIKVQEFVFPIHGNGQYINNEDIKSIIASLCIVQQGGRYQDNTGKSKFFPRESKNPDNSAGRPIQENKNKQYIDTNKTVMKINESQLRKIIRESVNNILQENDFYIDGAIPYQHKDTTNYDTYMKIANLVSAVYFTLAFYKKKAEINPEINKLMGNPKRGTTMVQSIEKAFQHLLEIKNVAETELLGGKSNKPS